MKSSMEASGKILLKVHLHTSNMFSVRVKAMSKSNFRHKWNMQDRRIHAYRYNNDNGIISKFFNYI